MKSFNEFVSELTEGEVVPFGGGTSKWNWSIHQESRTPPQTDEESDSEEGVHKEHQTTDHQVELPNNPKLRHQHMLRLMMQHHDETLKKYPSPDYEHSMHLRPGEPIGRLHGVHWIEHTDMPESHDVSHRFEPVTSE